jgi:hypothetical protein
MNFTEAVKRIGMERKGKAACILLFSISFSCRDEMLPAIRHAKVSVIPRRVLFCWTELSFPLDTEEKYVSAEIKGACGKT